MYEDLNQTLESIGFGRYHYWVFFVGGSGWFIDMATGITTAVFFTSAGDEWNLSNTEKGVLASIYMAGMIIGASVCGSLGDKKGRMFPYKKTMLLLILSLVLLIFSVNIYMASVALLFLGFSTGGEVTVGGTVFQEFCPPSKQYLLTVLGTTWCLGAFVTALVVSALIALDLPIILWKSTCIYNLIIGVVFFLSRLRFPETPRYLVHNHRELEAQELLQRICKFNKKDLNISLEMLKFNSIEGTQSFTPLLENEAPKSTIMAIWQMEYLRETVVFGLAYFLANFGFCFLNFFMPELLKDAGVTGVLVYLTISIQQFGGIPGILLATYLVETKLGRKYSIVYPMIICGIVNLAFIFARSYWELLLFTSLSTLTNYLSWSVLYTIVPESYKTNVRNTGVGWANAMAKLGGLVGPLAGGIILDIPNGFYISIVLTCSMTALVGATGFLMKETKGKSIE